MAPACQEGLTYRVQVPRTTPGVEGVSVAQPPGPPLPPVVLSKLDPVVLFQNPDVP